LRRLLCSVERFRERAIFRGLAFLKTFDSRSRALLCFVTRADQRFFDRRRRFDDIFVLLATNCSSFAKIVSQPPGRMRVIFGNEADCSGACVKHRTL